DRRADAPCPRALRAQRRRPCEGGPRDREEARAQDRGAECRADRRGEGRRRDSCTLQQSLAILREVDVVLLQPAVHLHALFAELAADGGDVPAMAFEEGPQLLSVGRPSLEK